MMIRQLTAMRLGMIFLLALTPAMAQVTEPTVTLKIGTPQPVFEKTYGKPFGPMSVTANDDNAKIGAPVGKWVSYHLTASGGRMYVTMVHFSSSPQAETKKTQAIDSLMLMLNGPWTVAQILHDQPEFTDVCRNMCDIRRIVNWNGNPSLFLISKDEHTKTVLYFEGDSAVRKWSSVTSLDSVVSWAYAISKSDFESHHAGIASTLIGTWPTAQR